MKNVPLKANINISDIEKIDVRVGEILKVEDVLGSEKLVKLIVDFGEFKRQILVGMKKEWDNIQEIKGLKALFIVNLEPEVMAGEVSEGMLFDIGYQNDITPVLALPEKDVPNGSCAG